MLITFWIFASSLACVLAASRPLQGSDDSLLDRLLGESRKTLSVTFYNQADVYFHKGVTHTQPTAFQDTLFQQWGNIITPRQHVHAEGPLSAEILPWLKLAAHADPHNVDAYLVASFWAETGLNRHDLATGILKEAQRLNPADYRIALEKARMEIRTAQYEAAMNSLDHASILLAQNPLDTESDMDKAEICTFSGFILEMKGLTEKAVVNYKNVLVIFPERFYIKERMAILEAGGKPVDSAQDLLKRLTRQTAHDACKDEDENHDNSKHINHNG